MSLLLYGTIGVADTQQYLLEKMDWVRAYDPEQLAI